MTQSAFAKRMALALQNSVEKMAGRWPGGTPGNKGGQFAPKGTGGSGMKSLFDLKSLASFAPGASGGQGGAKGNKTYGSDLFPAQGAGKPYTPPPPPPGAKPHPHVDDKGKPVTINYPTKASDPSTWTDPKKIATFTPGGDAPAVLNGIPLKPWADAPTTDAGWENVAGQNPRLETGFPFEPHPTKYTAAGVIIKEPDGRIWLTRPTNSFGGYQNTFPKGTVEHGLNLQASAIKEAYEETGLQVRIVGVAGDFEKTTSFARFFIAERVGGTPKDMGWESQAMRLAPKAELHKLLNVGADKDIVDTLDFEGLWKAGKANSHVAGQARWPSGTPLGGQWMAVGADGLTMPPQIGGGLQGSNPSHQKKALAALSAAKNGALNTVVDAAILLTKKAADNAAKGIKNGNAKYTAQTAQYIAKLVADMTSKPAAVAAATVAVGPAKLSDLVLTGSKPGGSNPGGMYDDGTGTKILVKGNKQFAQGAYDLKTNDDRAKNEVLASKLMLACGVGAPQMGLIDLQGKYGGGLGVTSQMVTGATAFNPNNAAHRAAAQADFAVHAWLGNYDVMGMGFDNTVIVYGKAVNIDPGGALLFRAQGMKKDSFGKDASEFESMRVTTSEQVQVYGTMTASQLYDSAAKLALIRDDMIVKLVTSHGPGTLAEKAALSGTLIARRDAILTKAGVKVSPSGSALPPQAVPVKPPEPPVVAATVKAPTPPGSFHAPTFVGNANASKFYADKAAAALAAHAAGDQAAFAALAKPYKSGKEAWPNNTPNGKAMTAFYSQLKADLDAKIATQAQAVANGGATVTGGGATWTGDGKGVLQPVAGKATYSLPEAKVNEILAANGLIGGPNSNAGKMAALAAKGDVIGLSAFDTKMPGLMQLKVDLMSAMQRLPAAPAPAPASAPKAAGLSQAAVGSLMLQAGYPIKTMGTVKAAAEAAKAGDFMAVANIKMISPKGKAFQQMLVDAMVAQNVQSATQAPQTRPEPIAPAPKAPTVAAPPFGSYKLPDSNSNAKSHNTKVDAISAAFFFGDEKSLLAMGYSTNTQGKKQAQLANDALAALGSVHKVAAGQKANAHPSLIGGTGQPGTGPALKAPTPPPAAGKPDPGPIPASKLPPPPDVYNYGGNGSAYSSKAWKNEANAQMLAAIQTAALTGGVDAVRALTFPELDGNTGTPTGKTLPVKNHPSAKLISAYITDVSDAIEAHLNPPKPIAAFNVIQSGTAADVAKHFSGTPLLTTASSQPKDHQLGFWIALGAVADTKALNAPAPKAFNSAKVAAGVTAWNAYSADTKWMTKTIQSSSALNNAYRAGAKTYDGKDLKQLAKAAYKDATPLQPGDAFFRYQSMPKTMVDQMMATPDGVVFQATGPLCTTHTEGATKGFGSHKMTLIAAPGAKALMTYGSGGFSGEKEVSTLPGQRFVLLSKKKDSNGHLDFTVLMLPPEENYP